jgi:hypothetical protein
MRVYPLSQSIGCARNLCAGLANRVDRVASARSPRDMPCFHVGAGATPLTPWAQPCKRTPSLAGLCSSAGSACSMPSRQSVSTDFAGPDPHGNRIRGREALRCVVEPSQVIPVLVHVGGHLIGRRFLRRQLRCACDDDDVAPRLSPSKWSATLA